MGVETFVAFTVAMIVLSATPGPGCAMVIARALAGGFRSGLAAVLGLVLGDLLYLVLAVFGLSALATLMGEFFLVVKILGAAYLIWLGVRCWRAPVDPGSARPSRDRRGLGRSFGLGLFVTLGNPKVILFYVAFVPTFVDPTALSAWDLALLCSVVAGVLLAVLGGYASLAARAGRLFRSERALRRLNRISGGLLMGAGVAVATR
ncbi:MAG: LysE family translocator [Kiloniellales bacterium]|nr:LysE family translocator [Kiloniellales bacterium]